VAAAREQLIVAAVLDHAAVLGHGIERRLAEAHRKPPLRHGDRRVRWRGRHLLGARRRRPRVTA